MKPKRCSSCHIHAPDALFHRDRTRTDGLETRCKPCSNTRRSARLRRRQEALGKELCSVDPREWTCGVCSSRTGDSLGRPVHLDVDPVTVEVRGRLCAACSSGLGAFKHDPSRLWAALNYLGASLCESVG